jgi:GT2 family glycosyltransferase
MSVTRTGSGSRVERRALPVRSAGCLSPAAAVWAATQAAAIAFTRSATCAQRERPPAPAANASASVAALTATATPARERDAPWAAPPRVSAVVPTYNRSDLLARCLAALLAQDLPPDTYEIVVADDAASPATAALVARWAEQAPCAVRYLAVTGTHGPAAARNRGWQAARGDVIAFTDDDCVPRPGWLRAGLAACADGLAAVAGRVVMPLPAVPTDYERDAAGLERGEFVTANCFCRRAALTAVGGFDERFPAAWREDSDLHFALLERGARIAPAPEAVVVHPVRPGRWGISLHQQRKAQHNALLYKKHPALYCQRIQAAPPWRYYASVGALLAAAGAATRGRRGLALGAAAAWAVLTAEFGARRLRGTSHAPSHVAEMAVSSALIPPLAVYWRLRGALKYRVAFL